MYIIDFEARPGKGGKEVHWVHYAANAAESVTASTWVPVKHVMPPDPESGKEVDELVHARWEHDFGPAYENWLRGAALPEKGTALSAWPALQPVQLKAFQSAGVRSVEDVANMNDTVMAKIRLPSVRNFKEQAQRFLDAQGTADIVARLDAKDAQIAELMEQIQAMQAPKKKPGRPPRKEEDNDAGQDSA